MTAKRFELCDVDLYEYGMPLNEIIDNGVPLSQNQVCELLNELHEENQSLKFQLDECQNHKLFSRRELEKENEQLKKAIVETEKMVQSTYDELTKLRCFKKNILQIKHSWDFLMEAIQYD